MKIIKDKITLKEFEVIAQKIKKIVNKLVKNELYYPKYLLQEIKVLEEK